MATNITEYNATAGSNTSIDSINLQENQMVASDVNNALRSLMSHLKNVDTGSQALTALSVTGATTSGTLKVSDGGTIGSASDTDAMAISSGGVVNFTQTPTLLDKTLTNTPAFLAKMSANQDITSATDTKIQFDTEVYDTDSKYDHSTNYRFTPQTAGKYYIYAGARANVAPSTLSKMQMNIYKNGSAITGIGQQATDFRDNRGGDTGVFGAGIIELNGSTDYVELYVQVDGDSTVTAKGNDTFLGGFLLSST